MRLGPGLCKRIAHTRTVSTNRQADPPPRTEGCGNSRDPFSLSPPRPLRAHDGAAIEPGTAGSASYPVQDTDFFSPQQALGRTSGPHHATIPPRLLKLSLELWQPAPAGGVSTLQEPRGRTARRPRGARATGRRTVPGPANEGGAALPRKIPLESLAGGTEGG